MYRKEADITPKGRRTIIEDPSPAQKHAITEKGRNDQLINLAINLAEQQLRDGTASSQVITHYLKLASERDRLERELLAKQTELVEAKIQNLQSAQRIEELYTNALTAMRSYQGAKDEPTD